MNAGDRLGPYEILAPFGAGGRSAISLGCYGISDRSSYSAVVRH